LFAHHQYFNNVYEQVMTPMRSHDLLLKEGSSHPPLKEDKDRITTEEAVKIIMDATDRRARKV
jgi:hypothetical protein